MLWLALLPTAGRLHRATILADDARPLAVSGIERGFGAICSARGLVYDITLAADEAAAFAAADTAFTDADGGDPAPASHGDDCDYCSLARATSLVVALAAVPPSPSAETPAPRAFRDSAPSSRAYGLGARGPPLV